jgi:hypothetical protein
MMAQRKIEPLVVTADGFLIKPSLLARADEMIE